jgi:hypothetical protein
MILKFNTNLNKGMNSLIDGLIPPIIGYEKMEDFIEDYYNMATFYSSENYTLSGLFDWEIETLKGYLRKNKKCFIYGAGTGREAIALTKKKIQVEAFECNEILVKNGMSIIKSNEINCEIKLSEKNIFPEKIKNEKFDFGITGWGTYGQILKSTHRIQLLKEIKKVVTGPVLISFIWQNEGNYNKITNYFRTIMEKIPILTEEIDENLRFTPNGTFIEFNEEKLIAESAMAGYEIKKLSKYKGPCALLYPL